MQTLLQTALRPMRRMRSAALARPTLQSWRPFSTDLAGVVKAEVKAGSIDVARTLDTSAMAKGSGGGGGDSSSGSKSPFLPMGDISKIKDMATPEKITLLVEAFASLNIVEAMLFTEAMKKKLNMPTDVVLTTRSGYAAGPPAGAPAAAAPGAPAAAGAPAAGAAPGGKPAAAEEKTTVDIKLKSFKAESKIKVIKEVRGVTSLGLKEAKELVESAPCTLMTKVKREDALKIVEKLKTEAQAECELV